MLQQGAQGSALSQGEGEDPTIKVRELQLQEQLKLHNATVLVCCTLNQPDDEITCSSKYNEIK